MQGHIASLQEAPVSRWGGACGAEDLSPQDRRERTQSRGEGQEGQGEKLWQQVLP